MSFIHFPFKILLIQRSDVMREKGKVGISWHRRLQKSPQGEAFLFPDVVLLSRRQKRHRPIHPSHVSLYAVQWALRLFAHLRSNVASNGKSRRRSPLSVRGGDVTRFDAPRGLHSWKPQLIFEQGKVRSLALVRAPRESREKRRLFYFIALKSSRFVGVKQRLFSTLKNSPRRRRRRRRQT